ncbi:MAG: hypothetical protein KIT84_44700 [Labilithrix sp.]|nr:hypothetical protein [Labilithrix sp.]MCW5818181.1 hypothetical protein [Labilithrix sp.]
MRVAPLVLRGCIVVGIVGSCSSSEKRSAVHTAELDRDAVARVTGTWETDGVAITICDDRTQSFCANDTCKLPCHDHTREGKDETLTYEETDLGCDCYDCECYDVRGGFAITARAIEGGSVTTTFYGDAIDTRWSKLSSKEPRWSLELFNTGVSRTTRIAARWTIARDDDSGADTLRIPPPPDAGRAFDFDHLRKTKSGADACP